MDLIVVDIETYYSQDFSLSKITIEEYVRSAEFEVIGIAIKVNSNPTEWASGSHEELREWLHTFNWGNAIVVAHNTMFDGAILSWRFGIRPHVWGDTLCMGRALHGIEVGGSLSAMAQRYKLGEKGNEVIRAKGKRRADFSDVELSYYGDYCINDVDLTYKLFNTMAKDFPRQELKIINLTLRMFIEPELSLNLDILEDHLQDVKKIKEDLLELAGASKEILMSNPRFAALLLEFGIEPPRKISLTTGKETWALAKNDDGFKSLLEHVDIRVQALASARLGTKSTLEETRTQRFIDIANRGLLPVPIRYYAAHTGRFGGDDKINLQNLPSRGSNAKKLKRAICAPKDHVIIEADSSQIEARVLAWLAGHDKLVEAFALGKDVYKQMASSIYNTPEDQVTKEQRFIGKTTILGCFGADTPVLTNYGWKRIIEVKITDMVWDGTEWVKHQGVIPKGLREVVTAYGIDATPEHEILTEHGWREWQEVATNHTLFQSALRKANSQLSTGDNTLNRLVDQQGGIHLCDVRAGGKDLLTGITLKPSVLLDAIRVLKAQVIKHVKSIGGMKILSQTWNSVNVYLTGLLAALHDAIQRLVKHTLTTAAEGSLYTNRGELTEVLSYDTSSPWITGKTKTATSTASTTVKDMHPTTYVLQHDPRTQKIDVQQVQCKKKLMTYDIAYAGPRNRFTIATDAGNLIVHNCGYGMGAVKFKDQLKAMSGVVITEAESRRIINIYRSTNSDIVELWREAQYALTCMAQKQRTVFGKSGVLEIMDFPAIKLPSGLLMRYDGLVAEQGEKGLQYNYRTRKGMTRIYGGKVVENACQAIARCIIAEQMLRVAKKYKVVMTVHDSIVCIAHEDEAQTAQQYVESCMRWTPIWARGLPVDCESGFAKNYGDC
jgi:DNA polymerase I-like protein with 3'-5' exonuclease and polymerase domains